MTYGISRIAVMAALASTALSAPARAQGADETPEFLGTIVVSALKIATERLRSGVSVTVVSEEDLAASGDIHLGTYLGRLPGISVAQTGPLGGATSLRIRGAEPRYIAVYIDGIRVDDPTGIATEFDFGTLLTSDVGRVEVLRGSQSALWGGSAVGGVINITSRSALEDGLHHHLAVEGGSHDTAALRYGLTYRDDRAEASFNFARAKTDGFSSFDTIPRDPSLEDDGFRATRLSLSGRYQLTDNLSLGASVFAQNSDADYDAYGADDPNNHQNRREFGGRLFADYEAGNTLHHLEMSRYRISREDEPANTRFLGVRTSLAYQGTTEVSPAWTLVYGADTMKETAVNAALPDGASTRSSGAFVQGIWSPTEDLDLSMSLRRDENSTYGGATSGRLALAYQASADLTLRGAVSTGFRAPSLYEQYGDSTWGIAANPEASSESSRSFEIGADYRMGDRAAVALTVFRIDVEDALTYCGMWANACVTPIPAGFTNLYENVPGTSKRQGVELSGEVALNDGLRLAAGYTYTDARAPSGTALARVPRHSLSVNLEADITPSLSGLLGVQRVIGRPAEFGVLADDYTVVNAAFSYDISDAAQVSMRLDNLFDEDYQVVPSYGTSGRAAYLTLETRF